MNLAFDSRLIPGVPQNRQRLVFALLLATALALTMGVGRADAHAIVVQTEPADGAELMASPRQIRVWFSEPVTPNLTQIELVDSTGKATPVTFVEEPVGAPFGPSTQVILDVTVPTLAPGAYRMAWKTVSSSDLHATSGTLVFGVQAPAVAAPSAERPAPDALEVVLRWLVLASLAGLEGAVVLAWLLGTLERAGRPGLAPDTIGKAHGRLMVLAIIAAAAGLMAGLALLAAQLLELRGSWQQILLETRYGGYWLARQGTLGILTLGAIWEFRERRRRWLGTMGLGVVALAVLEILATHISDLYGFSWLRLGAASVHALGAGLWAGGVAALALTCWPMLRRGASERALAQAMLRGFGGLALISVLVLGVTGLYLGGQLVASVDAFLETFYGQTLLVKIGVVLATGLIGLVNSASLHEVLARPLRLVLRRPAGWTLFGLNRMRKTLAAEGVLAMAVLLATAVLGAAQPARGREFEAKPGAEAVPAIVAAEQPVAPDEVTAKADDLLLTLSVKPDRPGENFVAVGVYNTRRPNPASIDKVLVRFGRPGSTGNVLTAVADSLGGGRYQVSGGMIDAPGDWRLTVMVQRPGMADAQLAVNWWVLAPSVATASRPVWVSNRPLAPVLNVAALALGIAAALGGLAWAGLRWGRQRRAGSREAASATAGRN